MEGKCFLFQLLLLLLQHLLLRLLPESLLHIGFIKMHKKEMTSKSNAAKHPVLLNLMRARK